ncbi:MAG: adenylate/guanylate cyclase domain-containing protein [Hyphomonadaceae bacterium]|nr:adenylate/guanylate cyclase domain-containing protein [Hyphomonadaceae bacterium]
MAPALPQNRKLAAIVSCDIAGYSALSENDPARAIASVEELRRHAEALTAEHGGRIFSTAGDGAMLEFATATDALNAAIRLAGVLKNPPLRCGVHLGEVTVTKNGDLLGHNVNVAARLQSEAPPAGVLVSQSVRDLLDADTANQLTPRGKIKLAKMRQTMAVFVYGDLKPNPTAQPTLAVLPFDPSARDRRSRALSDGVSEEILYAVSRTPGLRVIGSTSSFTFRGRHKPKAAEALNATHILDGSVRRMDDNVRITTQLTEAGTGLVLWSERYERALGDAMALQDEIAGEVAKALAIAMREAGRARPPKLTAALFESYLQAREHLRAGAPAQTAMAATKLERVVAEAPDFARAWAGLAAARLETLRLAATDRANLLTVTRDAAERAIGLDPGAAEALAVLASLQSEFGRWREREALLERALEAEPNNPLLLFRHGQFLVSVGRVAAGYAQQARAFELDPLDPMLAAFHGYNVWSKISKDEGRKVLADAHALYPNNVFVWYMRLNIAALDGDFAEAAALREDGVRLLPHLMHSPTYLAGKMMQDVLASPSPEAFMKLGADFAAMAERQPSASLDLGVALAVLGFTGPALTLFAQALDNIDAWRLDALEAVRPHIGYETALLFIDQTRALRMDQGFPPLCARLGLTHYWRETENWPDCVEETSYAYDFKAACAEL